MLERFNFKLTFGIILSIGIWNAFGFSTIMDSVHPCLFKKIVYIISMTLHELSEKGQGMLYMLILVKIYGTEGGLKAYAVACTYTLVYGVIGIFYAKLVYNQFLLKYLPSTYIFGSFVIISLFLLISVFKGSKTNNY